MTGLTIPGGPAARPRAPDPVEDALAGLGEALQADHQAYALDRAELDAARRMNALSAEAQQQPDPYEAERLWTEGVEALRAQAPESDDFANAFEGLRDSHAMVLGPQFLTRKAEAQAHLLDEVSAELGDTWLAASGPGRRVVEQQMADTLMRRVARGQMTTEQAADAADAWLDRLAEAEADGDEEEPEFFAPVDPDPADLVMDRLQADPALQRLAEAQGYLPDSAAAVDRMAQLLDRAEALPEDERAAFIEARTQQARQARRAALPRPAFAGPGPIDPATLSQAAARLREAWQAGQINDDEFTRQAELLRDHQELSDA